MLTAYTELFQAAQALRDKLTPELRATMPAAELAHLDFALCNVRDARQQAKDNDAKITEAIQQYDSDEIDFDPEPCVSLAEDGSGIWVSAWVWVASAD